MSFSGSWAPHQIQQVWQKGVKDQNTESSRWRKDECGAWIYRPDHGMRDSDYGWEIDHIDGNPENNALSNLRPLQWENNVSRQKGPLTCPVTSDGVQNVKRKLS
ncbi:MAG: HNH endonuclease [Candidatus Bathyarchaeia archaeon]